MSPAAVTPTPTRRLLVEDHPEAGRPVRLAASWCASCGHAEYPRAAWCPRCGAETGPVELGPQGTVTGSTSVEHPSPGSVVEAPYAIVAVAFDAGVTVLGAVAGRIDVPVGAAVEAVALPIGADDWAYAFAVTDADAATDANADAVAGAGPAGGVER